MTDLNIHRTVDRIFITSQETACSSFCSSRCKSQKEYKSIVFFVNPNLFYLNKIQSIYGILYTDEK